VVIEGFRRFGARLGAVGATDDPVADLHRFLAVYRESALADPHLFAAMFGNRVVDSLLTDEDRTAALATFIALVEAVQRCIDAGRVAPTAADLMALELWSAVHGLCCIELGAGLATPDQAPRALASVVRRIVVGAGDDPSAAAASIPDPG
jgi:AcrR family transcriptional regulator